jgi:circadian clock protein KaiB
MSQLLFCSGLLMTPDNLADTWKFELYIIGDNRRSTLAMENLRGICKDHLEGHCRVDVFDVKEHPELLIEKKICVAPVLIKKYPLPERTLVGDLSATKKVLDGLDLEKPGAKPAGETAYREGLRKQGLTFKWHHGPQRR